MSCSLCSHQPERCSSSRAIAEMRYRSQLSNLGKASNLRGRQVAKQDYLDKAHDLFKDCIFLTMGSSVPGMFVGLVGSIVLTPTEVLHGLREGCRKSRLKTNAY